jgi:hypothetical protein
MRAGNHGNVREKNDPGGNQPLFSIFEPHDITAHAEPTFLQFIIGLTRHRYRRDLSNLSDLFHHQRRWTGNWY